MVCCLEMTVWRFGQERGQGRVEEVHPEDCCEERESSLCCQTHGPPWLSCTAASWWGPSPPPPRWIHLWPPAHCHYSYCLHWSLPGDEHQFQINSLIGLAFFRIFWFQKYVVLRKLESQFTTVLLKIITVIEIYNQNNVEISLENTTFLEILLVNNR